MSKIFFSYRRDDSRLMCDRIYDDLQHAFGRDKVFRDIDNIPAGVLFPAYVSNAFSDCSVVLVLIGPEWLTIANESGRRLENERDYVRVEIESALEHGIPIIPLLILNAEMPVPEQLPESIWQLAMFNALRVRPDPDFHHDMEEVTRSVARYMPKGSRHAIPRRLLIGVAAGIGVAALGAVVVAKGGSFFDSPRVSSPQYPDVGGTWNGTLTILTDNGPTGAVQLTLRQRQAHLEGNMTFEAPLSPKNDGTIDGTISTDDTVKFTLENNLHTETLVLDGTFVPAQNAMSGTYSTTHGYSGVWQVSRSATT